LPVVRVNVNQRIYRAPTAYWLISTLVVLALFSVPVIVGGGIPGFPDIGEATTKWHRYYAARRLDALVLALLWVATMGVFAYFAIRALLLLVNPLSFRGTVNEVDATEAKTKGIGWIELSGVRRKIRYEERAFLVLENQRKTKAAVHIGVGVGNRIVFLDVVREP